MLIAILSDIHGNLEAFQQVIAHMEGRSPDMVICLGDLIGYGPDPDEVVRLFQHNRYKSVLGNHEAALQNQRIRNWFNFPARKNSLETEKLLSSESYDFCCALPENMTFANALFVHGFPPASVLRYVTMASEGDLRKYFENTDVHLCFVGHTHELLVFCWDGVSVQRDHLGQEKYRLDPKNRYIINVGSVGQPRDGTKRAKYILWDTISDHLEIIGVPYDNAATARKIRDRGFPEAFWRRLL